jgi:uncharacterized protein
VERSEQAFVVGPKPALRVKRIWIDLDNSPHVPFFRPIIDELRARGYTVQITARDAFQVAALASLHRLECEAIGRHYGKNPLMKVAGLIARTAQLLPWVMRTGPELAVSHGSRAQALAAKLCGIPSILIADYEHAQHVAQPDLLMVPEAIPDARVQRVAKRLFKYPGIKEDVYVSGFRPDPSLLRQLGFAEHDVIVTVRPPATEAHYHNPESEQLFAQVMRRLEERADVRAVLLPRGKAQESEIRQRWASALASRKIVIPESAVDGLNLIWCSDLVVSGGGTMNREAAALGVRVYSIFRGKPGAVDQYLEAQGRLKMIRSVDEVRDQIGLEKRAQPERLAFGDTRALQAIVAQIESLALGAAKATRNEAVAA